jgi:hypothetical protein
MKKNRERIGKEEVRGTQEDTVVRNHDVRSHPVFYLIDQTLHK